MIRLTKKLRNEYTNLFNSMTINPDKLELVRRLASYINGNKKTYDIVAQMTGVPWYVVGLIHKMEAGIEDLISGKDGRSFLCNLFNGQPYYQRTTIVPKGKGPFKTWNGAAVEAMRELNEKMKKYIDDWDGQYTSGVILYLSEMHNGWGYRLYHPETLSPYLWSFSNKYLKGKYVSDGKYSKNTVSAQCGIAPILKVLLDSIKTGEQLPPVDTLPKTEAGALPKATQSKWQKFKRCLRRKFRF